MDRVSEKPGTILVIEDDQRMQKVLHRIFDEEGYRVVLAGDGVAGVEAFHASDPLAVVLDLVLPQLSGREVCKRIKAASPETPVLVLSAISEVVDKVLLLEFGAEDYITKPFSPRELLARVQAAIRRRRKPAPRAAERFGDCEINFATMSAWKAGKAVLLTAHEFKLLRFLMDNAERVLGREELLNEVWGYTAYPTTRTVDNQILKLRQKLESDPAEPRHLVTIHGAGYKFTP
jgi:DNA-binding response OmpR family regulator